MNSPGSHNRMYRMVIGLCSALALFLLAANLFVISQRKASVASSSSALDTDKRNSPVQATAASQPSRRAASPAAVAEAPFSWEPIESSDYKAYVANLRKLSFPEELIREIIVADVNKLYAAREEPLKWKTAPHDAPLSERRKSPTVQDIKNLMQLRDIQVEKQNVLEQLLGTRVPREILRTPNSRNYEGYEYAIAQLPPEKREAVQRLQEDEFLNDDLNQARAGGYGSREEVEEYRRLNDKHAAALQQVLTAEEYERYIMNSTPPGTEMARRVIGMEPTDEETLVMWRLTHEHWKETGGVYGRWRAEPRTRAEIAAADEKLNAGLKGALGDDRYIDYQMAVSETGQQMRNLAARYQLPRQTLTQAFALQTEVDNLEKTFGRRRSALGGLFSPEMARLQELQEKLHQTLGPEIWDSWNKGRKLSYDLQP